MEIEEVALSFLRNSMFKEKFNDCERFDEMKDFLIKSVRKSIFQPIKKKKGLLKTRGVCPNCSAIIVSKNKEYQNIIYCPYCGQRIRERNYIILEDPINFGGEVNGT